MVPCFLRRQKHPIMVVIACGKYTRGGSALIVEEPATEFVHEHVCLAVVGGVARFDIHRLQIRIDVHHYLRPIVFMDNTVLFKFENVVLMLALIGPASRLPQFVFDRFSLHYIYFLLINFCVKYPIISIKSI